MGKHGAHSSTFIRMLPWLNYNIQKSFTGDIYEAIKVHVIVAFIINKAWFVIIFQYLSIGGVDNMETIKGEDAMVFELVGSRREGGRTHPTGPVFRLLDILSEGENIEYVVAKGSE